jgi:hypothetical protein
MASWKTTDCSRTMLHGVHFLPKSGHGNSVVLYLRRPLCPSFKIHNTRTTIYSRGGQRDDLKAPLFKYNCGISDALTEPFVTCQLLFFCSSIMIDYFGQLRVEFLQKIFQNIVQCQPRAHADYQLLFFTGNLCERHVTCASRVEATPDL